MNVGSIETTQNIILPFNRRTSASSLESILLHYARDLSKVYGNCNSKEKPTRINLAGFI
jgi:hypothetical protein